jgi:RNA polymerase sigma factor (TIGR02999 family)
MPADLDATKALEGHAHGDDERAAARLMPLVYDELRALAARYLRAERPGHSLQPTALVHEAYIRMVEVDRIDWKGKTHFFAMAATQMRRILVEHARAASARKRGARPARVTLTTGMNVGAGPSLDLLALDEALSELAALSPRQARVAEMKLFAEMEAREMALLLGVSERTVRGDWRLARAWLTRQLGKDR